MKEKMILYIAGIFLGIGKNGNNFLRGKGTIHKIYIFHFAWLRLINSNVGIVLALWVNPL